MVVALYPSLLSVRLRDRQPTTLMVRHADDPVNEREGERERERERERNLSCRRHGMDGNFSSSELISQS